MVGKLTVKAWAENPNITAQNQKGKEKKSEGQGDATVGGPGPAPASIIKSQMR